MKNPTFQIAPCPLEVPAALLALDPDTAVTALRHWFDIAIEETTNAGQLKSEIEQRIKDQAAGLFSIDEAACIIAEKTGEWPKKARAQIWQGIHDGHMVPVSYKTRARLPLPLTDADKRLALIRTQELTNVFEAWPLKSEPQLNDGWKEKARTQARAIIKSKGKGKNDLHPTLLEIADAIAKDWRERKEFGPKGTPLKGAYIKRHALQGHGIAIDRKNIISTAKGRGK